MNILINILALLLLICGFVLVEHSVFISGFALIFIGLFIGLINIIKNENKT
jgi:hypothetical protein